MEFTTTTSTANLPAIADKMARANRKAAKAGQGEFVMTTGEKREVKEDGRVVGYTVEVTITGPELVTEDGWNLRARVDHAAAAENIVDALPNCPEDFDLSPWYTERPKCDHCGTKRSRKVSYVFQNEDGRIQTVGSTCLGDFLGKFSAQNIARTYSAFGKLADDIDGFGCLPADNRIATADLLTHAACEVRLHGWVSATVAREHEGMESTAGKVQDQMHYRNSKVQALRDLYVLPTDEDVARAAEAREWIANEERGTDYIRNLALLTEQDWVEPKRLSFVASLIGAYERHTGRLAEQAARREAEKASRDEHGPSEWIANVKDRITLDLTVVRTFVRDGNYGPSTYIIALTPDHDEVTWSATGEWDLNPGDEFTVKATVKAHENYTNKRTDETTKQTVITRGKVVVEQTAIEVNEENTDVVAGVVGYIDSTGKRRAASGHYSINALLHDPDIDAVQALVEMDDGIRRAATA